MNLTDHEENLIACGAVASYAEYVAINEKLFAVYDQLVAKRAARKAAARKAARAAKKSN